ncbi:MAG: metallophosphoesterase [Akkermansiaceae bacterium]|nr:metallophosphoesterase [Armatimonadota bacterium]
MNTIEKEYGAQTPQTEIPVVSRRGFIGRGVLLAATGLTAGQGAAAPPAAREPVASRAGADSFSFVHITDTHIQPEKGAVAGVKKAFAAIAALSPKPDFALIGGDIVHAASNANRDRATLLYELWREAVAGLEIPVHYSVGNGDVFSTIGAEHLAPMHPDYGKSGWMRRLGLGQRFHHFDHGGWRFVVLDSVRIDPSAETGYVGEIDPEQMKWLDGIMRGTEKAQPVVILTHIPLMTLFGLYTGGTTTALPPNLIVQNGREVVEMFRGRNVRAVFQGHTHVVENCEYLGTRYITGGAVCGGWWQGPRFGTHPEGFGVVHVTGGQMNYRYVPYGWTPRP